MVFGLFSKDRARRRAIDVMVSKHRQSADRFAAMEKLKAEGSEEALLGLCRRFSITADKTIEDQQEKEWVVDTLVGAGPAAIPPLRRHLRDALALHFPLVTLSRIADADKVLEVIDELLAREEPGYTRDPKRKMDILEFLGEWPPATPEQVCRRAAPYLADFDEGVRFTAVETIAQKPHEAAAAGLVAALVRPEEESKRLRLRIAAVLAAAGFELGDRVSDVSSLLPGVLAGYALHHDKLVQG
jgi:hypothetical protein